MANVRKGKGKPTPVTILFYPADLIALQRIKNDMGGHASKGDVVRLCINMIDQQITKFKHVNKEKETNE